MTEADRKSHWEEVYGHKAETEVSWFQETPAISLDIIGDVWGAKPARLIDIGGGASRLADSLLAAGRFEISVLDLSGAALRAAADRIGPAAEAIKWIEADVTTWRPDGSYDIWHDRAAFHFLVDPRDQLAYAAVLHRALKPGGIAIIGTFAPGGPEKCSGLPIRQHDSASIGGLLGADYQLVDSRSHDHLTPWNSVQAFQFSTFRKLGA